MLSVPIAIFQRILIAFRGIAVIKYEKMLNLVTDQVKAHQPLDTVFMPSDRGKL